MELSVIIPHIEALIFASDKPLTKLDLVELVNNAIGFIEDRASLDQVETAVDAIKEKYQSEFYAFEVRESGGGLQFLTKGRYHKTVGQLNGEKFLKRLSTAALETLSIIAYKQPLTKGEIESIRGVNCDYAVQKLLEKELIIITGRKETAPGQPLIYATSKSFMDYFGINSVADLPKLNDVFAGDTVTPTAVGEANPVDEDAPIAEQQSLFIDEYGKVAEQAPDEHTEPLNAGEESLEEAVHDIEGELVVEDLEEQPAETNDEELTNEAETIAETENEETANNSETEVEPATEETENTDDNDTEEERKQGE